MPGLLILTLLFAPPEHAPVREFTLTTKDLRRSEDLSPNEEGWKGMINCGPGVELPASIVRNAHFNGTLQISNLDVGVYDGHHNGKFYEGNMLSTRFVDINGDGYLDLGLSGIVAFQDDDKGDQVVRRAAVVGIFLLEPKTRRFKLTYCENPDDALWYELDRTERLADARTLTTDDLRESDSAVIRAEWNGTIKCGAGMELPAKIEVTSKGNGLLEISNLAVRVYDAHDDGAQYEGSMLTTRFADIDGDGYLDLALSGIADFMDEKENPVLRRAAVAGIFLLEPRTKRFKLAYSENPEDVLYYRLDRAAD